MTQTALTDQTLVGVTNAGAQFAPSVAALPGGGYVIVWLDYDRNAIYGQRYDSAGQQVGGELQVSSGVGFAPLFASVGALEGGGFVVAWQYGSFGNADIHARRFDSSGLPISAEFTANSSLPNEQLDTRVIGLEGGGFLITWDNIVADQFQDISGRIFNSTGDPIGPDFTLNTTLPDSQGINSVAPLSGGGFVATWQSVTPEGSGHSVLIGQRFAANGGKVGGEFQVNTATANSPVGNDVAPLSDGGFVVSWVDQVPGYAGGRVVARHYDAGGNALGGEIAIASKASGGFNSTTVTALAGGGYLVGWTDHDSADNNVSARAMGANDAPLGNAFDVSTGAPYVASLYPDGAATLTNGHVVLTWDGPSTNTSEDAYYRMYAINPGAEGTTGDDTIAGTGADDLLNLSQGGSDMATSGGGNDGFYMGAALSAGDSLDGGAGILDQLGLQGNYGSPFVLSANHLVNIEMLVLLSGSDARFGDTSGNTYSYNLATVDANVAAGERLVVTFNTLGVGENVTFDGSAETDGWFFTFAGLGNDAITGGAQDDGFYFGNNGRWGAGDSVDGGAGTDQLGLQGDYSGASAITFGAAQITGVEMLVLLTGGDARFGNPAGIGYSYDLTMNDGNVAAGETLYVSANTLRAGVSGVTDETLTFNGSAESDGRFTIYSGAANDTLTGGANNDTIYGGGGADTMTGGAGNDTFAYMSAAHSTLAATDQILDFATGDKIDLSAIDAITGGANDAFAFIGSGAFSNTAGELRAFDTGGGVWQVQGDINGDGTADLVIAVTTGAPLVTTDFVL